MNHENPRDNSSHSGGTIDRTELASLATDLIYAVNASYLQQITETLRDIAEDAVESSREEIQEEKPFKEIADFEGMRKSHVWPQDMRRVKKNSGPDAAAEVAAFSKALEFEEYGERKARESTIASILNGSFYVTDNKDAVWTKEIQTHHVIEEARGLATDALYDVLGALQFRRLERLKAGQDQEAQLLAEIIQVLEEKAQLVRAGLDKT